MSWQRNNQENYDCNVAEPVQFYKKGLDGYQKIVSLLQLYSQVPPIAETEIELKVERYPSNKKETRTTTWS